MAVTYNQYRYNIEFRYDVNGKEVMIGPAALHYVAIDYDYDNRLGPTVVMKAAIDRNNLDHIVSTSGKGTMSVIIKKHVYEQEPKIEEVYINKKLIYFTEETLNPNKDIDYDSATDREDVFKIATVGFVDQDSMNGCKMTINEVIRGARLSDVLGYYLTLNHNLLMEPPRDVNIPLRIITPLTSVTQLVAFLDDLYGIYDGGYRLFFDFDKAYLLSQNGVKVQAKNEIITSVVINVGYQGSQSKTSAQGLGIDMEQKVYIIEVAAQDVTPYIEKSAPNVINKVDVIDKFGNVASQTSDVSKSMGVIPKTRVDSLPVGDRNQLTKREKRVIDYNAVIVQINKVDLDTSCFTINKEYTIKNYDKSDTNATGKFILSCKREMYIKEDRNLILSLIMIFRKVS
jgi:hypothetical protein